MLFLSRPTTWLDKWLSLSGGESKNVSGSSK